MPGDTAGHPDGRGGTCHCCLPTFHPTRTQQAPQERLASELLGRRDQERERQ